MALLNSITLGSIWLITVDDNPAGVVTAPQGSLAIDTANGNIYQNTNGGTAWVSRGTNIADIATWANRPTVNNDGDLIRLTDTGALYQYNSTIAEFTRPWVHAGTVVLDAKIDGDTSPDAESPVWVHSVGGATPGTISVSGGYVLMSAPTDDDRTAYITYTHGETAANHFAFGTFKQANLSADKPQARMIEIRNGAVQVILTAGRTAANGYVALAHTNGNLIGSCSANFDGSSDVYFELFIDGVSVTVFLDHVHAGHYSCAAPLASFPASAAETYRAGCITTTGQGDLYLKDAKFGQF